MQVVMILISVLFLLLFIIIKEEVSPRFQKYELNRFEKRGADYIIYLKDGRSFRGMENTWHSWPSGKKQSYRVNDILNGIYTKIEWELRDTKEVIDS